MESTSFYMILPSSTKSSDDIYPKNTASAFRIRLPKTIYLNNKYEVALAEITYPHSWPTFNFDDDYVFKYAVPSGEVISLSIPQGFYTNIEDLIRELNLALGNSTGVVFGYHPIPAKVRLYLKADHALMFSRGLADVLGFEYKEVYTQTTIGSYAADIKRGFNSLYVYCNICEPQIVGDAYVPLLRTVFITGHHGQVVNHIFESPHYVPVNTDSFDAIEINIKNDVNENVSFQSGKVICKLHFRQKAL